MSRMFIAVRPTVLQRQLRQLQTMRAVSAAAQMPPTPYGGNNPSKFEQAVPRASTSSPPRSAERTRPAQFTASAFSQALDAAVLAASSSNPAPRSAIDFDSDSWLLAKLARFVMRHGELMKAHSIIKQMLNYIHVKTATPPVPLVRKAIELCSPEIKMVSTQRGNKKVPAPVAISAKLRLRQAWVWIVESSPSKKNARGDTQYFGNRLAMEILKVLAGDSEALVKKELRHREAMKARAAVKGGRGNQR